MKFTTYKDRMVASASQDPMWCLESPMEQEVYGLFRDHKLMPEMQFKCGKYFLDFAFPSIEVAVEYDGAYHNDSEQVDKDIERDVELAKAGWVVARIYKSEKGFKLLWCWEEMSTTRYFRHTMDILCNVIKRIQEEHE